MDKFRLRFRGKQSGDSATIQNLMMPTNLVHTVVEPGNPGGAKKDRLSSPKYQMVIPQIAEDNEAVLQQWLRDSTTHINDTSEDKGQTALMLACRHGAVNCALLLLSSGANANLRMNADGSGGTGVVQCRREGETCK